MAITARHLWLPAVALLSACSTVSERSPDADTPAHQEPPPELAHLPEGAMQDPTPRMVDMQLAYWDRGLYLNDFAEVVPADSNPCGSIIVEAHRGDPAGPENTVESVVRAALAGFDAIEIDVMRLRDGVWVAHHDQQTGRVAGRPDGERSRVSRMNLAAWNALRVRDPETGRMREERPPTLEEIVVAFRRVAREGQVLNIDIKSNANEQSLREMDRLVRRNLQPDQYRYSSGNFNILARLRGINDDVYLGLIQSPHPESLQVLRGELEDAAAPDPIYQQHEESLRAAASVASWWYGLRARDYTSASDLQQIQEHLGPRAGLHLDIRRFAEVPAVRGRARAAGLEQVATYTINSPAYHEDTIKALDARGQAPGIVIVDSSIYQFCGRLYGHPEPRELHEPTTAVGQLIAALPRDADLRDLEALGTYAEEELYLTLDGTVRTLDRTDGDAASDAVESSGPARPDFSIPDRDGGRDADFGDLGPVRIRLGD